MVLRPIHVEQKQPYVDDSCKLLLHFNGVSGNQQFIDSSNNPKVVTTYGNACLSSSHYRFGGTSGYFDGTGDYLRVVSSDITPSTSDFTISFWMWETVATPNYGTPFSFSTGGTYSSHLTMMDLRNSTSTCLVFMGNNSNYITASFTRVQGQWNHWAYIRSGSTWTLYYNGSSVGSGTSTANDTSTYLQIGGDGTYYLNGYIDEFIYLKGVSLPIGMLYPQLRPYGYPIGGT